MPLRKMSVANCKALHAALYTKTWKAAVTLFRRVKHHCWARFWHTVKRRRSASITWIMRGTLIPSAAPSSQITRASRIQYSSIFWLDAGGSAIFGIWDCSLNSVCLRWFSQRWALRLQPPLILKVAHWVKSCSGIGSNVALGLKLIGDSTALNVTISHLRIDFWRLWNWHLG